MVITLSSSIEDPVSDGCEETRQARMKLERARGNDREGADNRVSVPRQILTHHTSRRSDRSGSRVDRIAALAPGRQQKLHLPIGVHRDTAFEKARRAG